MKKIAWIVVFLVWAGCSPIRLWYEPCALRVEPPPGTALASFVRGRHRELASVWDGEHLLGFLIPGKILQADLLPGKHLLVVYSKGMCDIVEGDLLEGEHYISRVRQFNVAGPKFFPVDPKEDPIKIQGWFWNYETISAVESYRKDYEERMGPVITQCIDNYQKTGETQPPLVPSPIQFETL